MADPGIMLTFDYELFLGRRSGSAENCLIAPTREILALLRQHAATALFFVDATYLARIEAGDRQTYAKVAGQIEEMIDAGCDVGFHLHPHWQDAVSIGGESWTLEDLSKYRLHALDAAALRQVFGESLASLTRAVSRADGSRKINTFRAGGWCLQPFSRLREFFEEFGIDYDFSVTPGLYRNSLPAHFYDYRKAPRDKAAWRFSNDPCMQEPNGRFVEVPVTAFRASLAGLVANKFHIKGQKIFGDGQGVSDGRFRELLGKVLATERLRQLTLDMCAHELLLQSLAQTRHLPLRVFASHPKIFSAASLANLDWLLQRHKTLRVEDVVQYV